MNKKPRSHKAEHAKRQARRSVRESFVTRFSEGQAKAIESAAAFHKNGIHDRQGSDPFKWAILICIGYQCAEVNGYREFHGIKPKWDDIKRWIKQHADLATHDGDCDYLSLVDGTYNEFMPKRNPSPRKKKTNALKRKGK